MNDAYTQQALAGDGTFRARVRAAIGKIAWQIVNEVTTTPNHPARLAYAQHVIRNTDSEVATIVSGFVMRPNVFNFDTSHVFDYVTQSGRTVSASGDADIESQLATDWDTMAAAAGFGAMTPVP